MAAKRFHVACPEQLQSMVMLVKQNAPTVARVARIWKITKAKKGETRWDRGIYAGFSGNYTREAVLFRFTSDDELVIFGTLKYNQALKWCEEHLRMVHD